VARESEARLKKTTSFTPKGKTGYLAEKERLKGSAFASFLFFVPPGSAKGEPPGMGHNRSSLSIKKTQLHLKGETAFLAEKERLELSRRFPDLRP
jgi:hypothetical protein